jgi:hypothetical protein
MQRAQGIEMPLPTQLHYRGRPMALIETAYFQGAEVKQPAGRNGQLPRCGGSHAPIQKRLFTNFRYAAACTPAVLNRT